MKYIFFVFYGVALPIAYHLKQEGHEVIVGEVANYRDILSQMEMGASAEDKSEIAIRASLHNGLLEKIPAEKLIEKMKTIQNKQDYFVFFESNYMFKFASQVQELGFHGNYPTEEDHLLEIDRNKAKDFVKKYYPNLSVADKKEFFKVEDGIKFLEKSDDTWVLKGLDENAKTFVPDAEDIDHARNQVIETLRTFPEKYEQAGFLLESMIPWMIEITPERIYYDGVPIVTTIDIENKPLGSGNLSFQTGCAADLVFPITMEDRINEVAFPPIVDEMAKQHKGLFFWDASLLISKRGGKIYFGEFCPNRPGYNSFFTELAQLPSVNHFFESIVQKKNPFRLGSIAASTTIFNLNRDPETYEILSNATIEYKPEIEKDLWMYEVVKTNKKLVNAGYDINLAAVTGSGNSFDEAIDKLYKNIGGFSFAGQYYRPKFDYISLDYPSSIPNRLNYALERKLFQLPFNVKIGGD